MTPRDAGAPDHDRAPDAVPGAARDIGSVSLGRAIAGALIVSLTESVLLAVGLGGFDALARHPRALALLAVWLAGNFATQLLRPVRRHDPLGEAIPESRGFFLALFLIPYLTPTLAALDERFGWWPLPGGDALRWAGVVMSGAGFALRIAALLRLGSRFSPLLVIQRGHALETSGPYAWVRHPGYLGSWLGTLGAVLAFGSGVALVPAFALFLMFDRRTRREDALLERQFGTEFREYGARTKRLLPGIY